MNNVNEAMPGNLGNLGGMPSYAEVERLVKQLYALVQEIHPDGGLVLTYVAPGAQNIGTLGSQTIIYQGGQGDSPKAANKQKPKEQVVELSTEEAQELLQKAKSAGYVDEDFQPLISRTQSAVLADEIAERLGIKDKWKTFETFWDRRNMYRDYHDALDQQQSLAFRDKLRALFG